MNLTSEYVLKNGQILITANGYAGEDDFYLMYEIIKEKISPEHIKFGVDSMCVDGSFIKDDITVRMSSESAYDYYCFVLDPAVINAEQIEIAKGWIEMLVKEIRTKHDPVEAEDDW
ncbi:MAG: histidine kinase [Eubacterium sp.]|nr:histidine kinase [Eubacterium sp.]